MSRTVQEALTRQPRALGGRGRHRTLLERLRLLAQTAIATVQVAWFTLVGWIGATVTLLPLAFHGGPLGRRDQRRALRFRLVRAPAEAEETAGR